MNLSVLRKRAKGLYGLAYADTPEDPFFTTSHMTDLVNAAHFELAKAALCYRQRQVYNLPVASSGRSSVSLACNVIEVRERAGESGVAGLIGGQWRDIKRILESEANRQFGIARLRASGEPTHYYTHLSDAVDSVRIMELVSPAAVAVTSGLEVDCYIYPTAMSADTDAPAIQLAEHELLLPGVVKRMCLADIGRNRDAPLDLWERRAYEAGMELRALCERFESGGVREVIYDGHEYE